MQFASFLVNEECHRDTPVTLTRHAPIRAVIDHRLQPSTTPGWKEFDPIQSTLTDLSKGFASAADLVHVDKVLWRGTEDDWGLMAPAMGVAMRQRGLVHQRTTFLQYFNDRWIGIPN